MTVTGAVTVGFGAVGFGAGGGFFAAGFAVTGAGSGEGPLAPMARPALTPRRAHTRRANQRRASGATANSVGRLFERSKAAVVPRKAISGDADARRAGTTDAGPMNDQLVLIAVDGSPAADAAAQLSRPWSL